MNTLRNGIENHQTSIKRENATIRKGEKTHGSSPLTIYIGIRGRVYSTNVGFHQNKVAQWMIPVGRLSVIFSKSVTDNHRRSGNKSYRTICMVQTSPMHGHQSPPAKKICNGKSWTGFTRRSISLDVTIFLPFSIKTYHESTENIRWSKISGCSRHSIYVFSRKDAKDTKATPDCRGRALRRP